MTKQYSKPALAPGLNWALRLYQRHLLFAFLFASERQHGICT
jgi:hypothetical protein